jgi:hypothetical protein
VREIPTDSSDGICLLFYWFASQFSVTKSEQTLSASNPSQNCSFRRCYKYFSFLKNGKLTNFKFPSSTGTVQGFAQDRHGIVWAVSARGVWRFDGSSWQQNPYEWNPQLSAAQVGFDREGIFWALTDRKSTEFGRQLFYLLPEGTKFRKAGNNLFVEGFTWDADATVLTTHEKDQPSQARVFAEQTLDRANGIWFVSSYDPLFRHPAGAPLAEVVSKASRSNSQVYDFDPYRYSRIVDREDIIWSGEVKIACSRR